jgi:type I restriction enzyme S subunit
MKPPFLPLKWLVAAGRRITYGIVQCGDDFPGGVPYIRPVDMDDERGAPIEKLRRTSPEIAAGYKRSFVRPGDLIVSIGPSFGKVMVARPEHAGANLTQGTALIAPGPLIHPRFLFWALRSPASKQFWDAAASGATFRALTLEILERTPIPSFELSEQRAVADFLDRETTIIDVLIEAKRKLIGLAVAKRSSYTAEVCIRGLDRGVPKKDSAIPTVGQIPEHWTVIRNRALFREVDERSVGGTEELLSVSHITGVTRRSEKPEVTMFMAESLEGYKKCSKDDLIINTMWAWMGALGISRSDGVVSPGYNVYRLRIKADPAFFDLLYRTPQYIAEFTRWSKGVWESRLRLYPFEFFQILTLLPPFEEQQAIASEVESKTGGIRNAIDALEISILRLEEHRSALVSAAVNGQIDVRTYRPEEATALCQ